MILALFVFKVQSPKNTYSFVLIEVIRHVWYTQEYITRVTSARESDLVDQSEPNLVFFVLSHPANLEMNCLSCLLSSYDPQQESRVDIQSK